MTTIVRVYFSEADAFLPEILDHLQKNLQLQGGSVFRAHSGFGQHGALTSSLVDLSLNLPLVLEFFEEDDKCQQAINYLKTKLAPHHIVSWQVALD